MNQLLEPLADGLGSFVGWAIIGPVAAIVELSRRGYRRLRSHRERLDDIEEHLNLDAETPRLDRHEERLDELQTLTQDQQRALYGDSNDPQDQGMRGEVHDIHESVQEHQEK